MMKKILLSLLAIVALVNVSLAQFPFDSCLVAHYPFSGDATDASTNGFDATVYGPVLGTDRHGNANSAYDFDGVNDYIELPSDFDLEFKTFVLWLNADVIGPGVTSPFDCDHPGLNYGKTALSVLQINNESRLNYPRVPNQQPSVQISEGGWYMATVVVKSDTTFYYLNGQAVDTVVAPAPYYASPNGHDKALVGTTRLFDRYFNGKIDDIRIYNCALAPSDVASLYDLTNMISGTVYTDENTNCNPDSAENKLAGRIVHVNPGGQYATTDSLGHYEFWVGTGSYTVTLAPRPHWTQDCPVGGTTVNFSSTDSVSADNNFSSYFVPSSQYPFDNCLVAYYPFSGDATDASINGFDATLHGPVLGSDRHGNPSSAYDFDGTNDWIELPSDFDLEQKTFVLWFNADVLSTTLGIPYDSDHSGLQYGKTGLTTFLENGQGRLNYPRTPGQQPSVVITEGRWYMATYVINYDTTFYYLNDQIIDTVIAPYYNSPNGHDKAVVGASRVFDRYFNGRIDDIRFYNCALDPSEVASLYDLTNVISGTVFTDVNANCAPDSGESRLAGRIVEANPGHHFATTDSLGNYEFWLGTGNYVVTLAQQAYWGQDCPLGGAHVVNFSTQDTSSSGNDFSSYITDYCVELNSGIGSAIQRRCFSNNHIVANVCNNGTITADSVVLTVHLPQEIVPLNSSAPWVSNTNGEYSFAVGTLEPGECYQLSITDSISCDATLGEMVCMYVEATSASAMCDTLVNTHTSNYHCAQIIGSFDPNDKQIASQDFRQNGYLFADNFSQGDTLNYMIRFQNTGNDTAFTVVVRDTLSEFVDPTTLVTDVTSHPHTYRLYGNGIAEWRFDNILLPDSFINEPLSHGFIKYHIMPRPNLVLGTEIFNSAAIYFDFNEPVITNETVSTLPLPVYEPENAQSSFVLYPNPTTGVVNFNLDNTESKRITVTDITGSLLMDTPLVSKQLDLTSFSHGVYMVSITDVAGNILHRGKVVKQ